MTDTRLVHGYCSDKNNEFNMYCAGKPWVIAYEGSCKNFLIFFLILPHTDSHTTGPDKSTGKTNFLKQLDQNHLKNQSQS